MKVIEDQITYDMPYGLNKIRTLWLDIETDGLSHSNQIAIIGLIFFSPDSSKGHLLQLFNNDGKSEKEILIKLLDLIKMHQTDYFISYNGNSFDFPFINARMKHHGLESRLNKSFNIDLLQIIRKNKSDLPLDQLNLKNIEKFLGIYRQDTISGLESVEQYMTFLKNGDSTLERQILLHNYDDIVNMLPLLDIFKHLKTPLAFYLNPIIIFEGSKWILSKYKISKDHLYLSWSSFEPLDKMPVIIHHMGYQIEASSSCIELKVSLKTLLDQELYIIDTLNVYNIDFRSLSNEDKQNHLIYNSGHLYTDNIKQLTIYLLMKTKK